MFATAGLSGLLFYGLRPSAVPNKVWADTPEVIALKASAARLATCSDRYNITRERHLAEAARKIELSYRQAKVAETQQDAEETKQEEPATIQ